MKTPAPKEQLKPCPHGCHKKWISLYQVTADNNKKGLWRMGCGGCRFHTYFPAKQAAVDAWNKRAEQTDKWVSVGKRLPDVGEKVQIYTSYKKQATATFEKEAKIDGVWMTNIFFDLMRQGHTHGSVTHWKSLPSPPKEEE